MPRHCLQFVETSNVSCWWHSSNASGEGIQTASWRSCCAAGLVGWLIRVYLKTYPIESHEDEQIRQWKWSFMAINPGYTPSPLMHATWNILIGTWHDMTWYDPSRHEAPLRTNNRSIAWEVAEIVWNCNDRILQAHNSASYIKYISVLSGLHSMKHLYWLRRWTL